MSQKPDRVAVTVIGCFGAFAIVVLAGAFGVLQWARGRRAPVPGEAAPAASAPDVTTSAQAASPWSGGAVSTSSDDEAPGTSTSSGGAVPTANTILENPSSPQDPPANGGAPAPSSIVPPSSGAPQVSSAGPSASSGSGCKLNINSIPTSMVQIDGRSVGSTPRLGLSVACGTRVVTFTHPEKGRKSVSVTASPTRVATVAVKF